MAGDQLEIEDFDTAKAVFEKLKDVPVERRKRILNWVAEGLGITLQASPPAAPAPTFTPTVPAASAAPAVHPQAPAVTDIKTFVATEAPKSDVNAADKHSSKNTYIEAAKLAKQTLIEARSRALIAAPTPATVRTVDSAPNFATLVSDPTMRSILERRWDECKRCIDAGAPLAATVMMGGLLEALLVARANKLSDKSKLFKA
jgi:hypothetical protein